ncbi:MAG: hypothetical protein F4015_06760 [Acidimicrobiia bacterium]|nr:hypothetical protein [Acidimicrobiia bacterium]
MLAYYTNAQSGTVGKALPVLTVECSRWQPGIQTMRVLLWDEELVAADDFSATAPVSYTVAGQTHSADWPAVTSLRYSPRTTTAPPPELAATLIEHLAGFEYSPNTLVETLSGRWKLALPPLYPPFVARLSRRRW